MQSVLHHETPSHLITDKCYLSCTNFYRILMTFGITRSAVSSDRTFHAVSSGRGAQQAFFFRSVVCMGFVAHVLRLSCLLQQPVAHTGDVLIFTVVQLVALQHCVLSAFNVPWTNRLVVSFVKCSGTVVHLGNIQ